jgi:hypothetical protein
MQEKQRKDIRLQALQAVREEGMAYEKALALFSQLHGQCLLCLITEQDLHDIDQCTHPQRKAFEEKVRLFKRQVKFAPYSGCFECGLPQQVCLSWEKVSRGFHKRPGGECQFGSLLMEAGAGLLWDMDHAPSGEEGVLVGRIREKIPQGGISRNQALGYLGQKIRWYGLESNRLVEESWLFYGDLMEDDDDDEDD